MEKLSKIPDEEIDKIADEMSNYFLKTIRKDSSEINFNVLEKRLEKKYIHDNHSAMFLDGRKGVRVIVDHGISKQWSEINCKTEIKIFEKSCMKVTDHIIAKEVYSYVVQSEDKFYKELEKIPDATWFGAISTTRSVPQDILSQIEKTAASIGFTLEEILQLIAENAHITELRSKTK
ncbi:MAG TPA: hypothetical protein OQH54_06715 [Nitrosopumilus sp.]|nr:hypothetical protein [Thermoproteota archaeon]HJJ23388.1 hypothetical protein [Nitrosopumilus sp.]